MGSSIFDSVDAAQLEVQGVSVDEVQRQLRLFEHPPDFIRLERACSVGDGIRRLSADDKAAARDAYESARQRGRLAKFVPASGAASRMFQALLAARGEPRPLRRETIAERAKQGDALAGEVLAFLDGLPRFAFAADLRAAHAGANNARAEDDLGALLEHLLTPGGLDYAALPKGVLRFHHYPDGARTPFEEHLVDASRWIADVQRVCRLHFTVSPEHRARFVALTDEVSDAYERRLGVRFHITFSVQKPLTDTIAVDLENRPFRTDAGRLLFRPAGHGALIENLNDFGADIVFLENVDNVVPDHLKDEVITWKQLLTGHLVALQEELFGHLAALTKDAVTPVAVAAAARFARDALGIALPDSPPSTVLRTCFGELTPFDGAQDMLRQAQGEPSGEEAIGLLRQQLDRPLRVCGMVRNVGEPGGGPFWVRGRDGALSLQIVESAQVDPATPDQRALCGASTHFNPVELACGVRDWRGAPFDLMRYVDPDAVFIARKSSDGRTVKALERPGLWNGAMAGWTTVFVEVPNLMFNPVKTVNDLLRPEHQPADHGIEGSKDQGIKGSDAEPAGARR